MTEPTLAESKEPISEEQLKVLEAFAKRATAPYLYDDDDDSDVLEIAPGELRTLICGYRMLWQIHGPMAGVYMKQAQEEPHGDD